MSNDLSIYFLFNEHLISKKEQDEKSVEDKDRCEYVPVGACREHLSKKFDEKIDI